MIARAIRAAAADSARSTSPVASDAGPSTNNSVTQNQVEENGSGNADTTDGIRAELGSTGNTFDGNHLRDNITHDCHDFNLIF